MNNTFFPLLVICGFSGLLLFGCGGGGGGGAAATTALNNFIKWSSITAPGTITVDGISQEANFVEADGAVDSVTPEAVDTLSSSATIAYAADGSVESVIVNTPYTNITFDVIDPDVEGYVPMSSGGGASIGVYIDPKSPSIDWEYQTFGMWETGLGTGSGTLGAMSIGAPTADSDIPADGAVTFLGVTAGYYVDATGVNAYETRSDIEVAVDFSSTELGVTTDNTILYSSSDKIWYHDSDLGLNLDMSGILNRTVGTNSFEGTLDAGDLSGPSTGQFYGPNAEELGGVFFLQNGVVETYGGAYGAAQ